MEVISKILLADSSDEFRLLLRHALEETGEFHVVGDTGDGDEAWELIQQTSPDVVVMDVILPGLDGVSLLQRMPKNVKTIVLSAFCSQNTVQEVMRLGAWYFIPKPAHLDSLLERIRQEGGNVQEFVRKVKNREDGVKLHVDHILPVSRGGKTVMSNLQTLCEDCNCGKGNRYLE